MENFWALYGEAARTATGFFWRAGWAFVLGYGVSAMIQAFVPKGRLTPYLGTAGFKGVSLATLFGSVSSSCSFAALATARALFVKGADFICAVAFMFASTNLVIELGVLIVIFLGWPYLAAELGGGVVLIAISSVLMALTCPQAWKNRARERAEHEGGGGEDRFDWKQRITSVQGWQRVGHIFTNEWKMVGEDILIGFTVAGFVSVFVPDQFWKSLFLAEAANIPPWAVTLEGALIGPVVAALTFIGSMGNIPLATVLSSSGVLFAGIMAFIYSDLMIPPLIRINAKYYGWRASLYIATVMYASIVCTALILNGLFAVAQVVPETSRKEIGHLTRFEIDGTFWMNLAAAAMAAWLVVLGRFFVRGERGGGHHHRRSGFGLAQVVAVIFIAILAGGWTSYLLTR